MYAGGAVSGTLPSLLSKQLRPKGRSNVDVPHLLSFYHLRRLFGGVASYQAVRPGSKSLMDV
jgi:hypothetical protein